MRGCEIVVILALSGATALAGCRKSESAKPAESAAAEAAKLQPKELPKPVHNPSGRWHITELKAKAEMPDDQRVPGLDDAALTAQLSETVRKMAQVSGFGPASEDVDDAHRLGVQVTVAWQLMDLEGRSQPSANAPAEGNLVLAVMAHAEQSAQKGEREMAERTIDATVPLPADREKGLAPFLMVRVQQATQQAISDVLGELWARGLDDAAVLALLDDEVPWRKMAGAREIGERELKSGRDRLEKAARDSRKDIATVAAAALGRLGDPHSVPVLERLLGAIHPEVIDAALVSLVDIGSPEALAAVKRVADEHDNPDIRQRAGSLLQERAARKPSH